MLVNTRFSNLLLSTTIAHKLIDSAHNRLKFAFYQSHVSKHLHCNCNYLIFTTRSGTIAAGTAKSHTKTYLTVYWNKFSTALIYEVAEVWVAITLILNDVASQKKEVHDHYNAQSRKNFTTVLVRQNVHSVVNPHIWSCTIISLCGHCIY